MLKYVLYFVSFVYSLNSVAQINPFTVIGVGTQVGKGIVGSIKDKKKAKNIQNSISEVEINGSQISILRVKDEKIISNAKGYVTNIQNTLDQYYTLYKSNQHIDIPYYYDDIAILKSLDSDWPADYYSKELAEYRRYEQLLTKQERRVKDSIDGAAQILKKRVLDSLQIVKKRTDDSLAYVTRIRGYSFVNKEYALLKEKPSEKSKTIGKIYLGSYVKVLGFSGATHYLAVSIEEIKGYVYETDLVDNIDNITVSNADIGTYRSRYYYKYEPNYDYVPEQEIVYSETIINSRATKGSGSSHTKRSSRQQVSYIRGPRGGCYYLTAAGNKVYVDRSLCN